MYMYCFPCEGRSHGRYQGGTAPQFGSSSWLRQRKWNLIDKLSWVIGTKVYCNTIGSVKLRSIYLTWNPEMNTQTLHVPHFLTLNSTQSTGCSMFTTALPGFPSLTIPATYAGSRRVWIHSWDVYAYSPLQQSGTQLWKSATFCYRSWGSLHPRCATLPWGERSFWLILSLYNNIHIYIYMWI